MECPPESDLLPFCEANDEWRELREREVEAWSAMQEKYRPRPCEPAEMTRLWEMSRRACYHEIVGERVRVQARLRLDRLRLGKNLNEQ